MKSRMANRKELVVGILVVALAALLVLTACAPRPVVEGKTVQFGVIMPITGPVSATTQINVAGGEDYVRYFNEQEAIPGMKIEYLWRDSAYQVSLFISQYEKFVEAGVPVIRADEASPLMAIRARLARDEVVMVMSGGGCHELSYPEPGWLYGVIPTQSEQAAVVLRYFMENWKEDRPPRLAFVGYEGLWGQEPRYATEYARGLGFEVLPPELVPMIVLDAAPLLLRLKEAGADLLYLQTIDTSSGPIVRDAERLGLLDQFQFAGASGAMSQRAIESIGVATEGFLVVRPYPWFAETEVPGIKLLIDNQMKYRGELMTETEYLYGSVSAAVVCEAMKRAIENVGYENLDSPAVKEALDSMKDFDVYGLASITYKPGDHRGSTKAAVYEVIGSEIVRVSDWQEAPSARDWQFE
jgi:branched-chain amino acid transport system substrate-binding protein